MMQESLEGETVIKETLVREVSEAKKLLSEERVLWGEERGRLAEKIEARQRLESLLASERKTEEKQVNDVTVLVLS